MTAVVCNVAYSGVVKFHGRFGGSYWLHIVPWWWRQQKRLTRCHIPEDNTLHGQCCDLLTSRSVFTAIGINQYGWIIKLARDISWPRIKRLLCRSNSEFRTIACWSVLEPVSLIYYIELATDCTLCGSIYCVGVTSFCPPAHPDWFWSWRCFLFSGFRRLFLRV
jgi:hypothetical protein